MYTNSTLTTYVGSGSEKRFARTKSISRITVHQTAGVVDLDGLNAIIKDARRNVSWHYGIDVNGKIGSFMSEQYATYSSNNTENDNIAINIIVSNSDDSNSYPISAKTYDALILLCTDICKRNGIELTYTGREAGSTLTMHRWYHRTICPGPYLAARFPDIVTKVNQGLAGYDPASYQTTLTTASAVTSGSMYGPSAFINYDALNPYIVTLSSTLTKSVNWTRFKANGVAGALIYAGALYDDIHLMRKSYQHPNTANQVKQCIAAEVPFGLIAEVRSRSVNEADQELQALRQTLRRYPPSLGIWLSTAFVKDKSMNDLIIDRYIKELSSWGFSGQIGLYMTPQQLKKISWKYRFSSQTSLCLNSHIARIDTVQELMTSSFFATE